MKRYLLQVWTKKGEMVFEKALQQPVCNWNISGNVFLFQEKTDSSDIFLLRLYKDQQAVLFKFKLPPNIFEGRINTKFDLD